MSLQHWDFALHLLCWMVWSILFVPYAYNELVKKVRVSKSLSISVITKETEDVY